VIRQTRPSRREVPDLPEKLRLAPLDPAKTVRYLTLPDVSDGVVAAQPAMHIFTTTIQ
jgi:hypothetical protein